MLLEGKNAMVYGAGGAIGDAVARTFAREGASVYLARRTREPLEAVVEVIEAVGGSAEVAEVAAFLASERAITGTLVNVTSGMFPSYYSWPGARSNEGGPFEETGCT